MSDLIDFLKDNLLMVVLTVLALCAMIWFISSELYSGNSIAGTRLTNTIQPSLLPNVPRSNLQPSDNQQTENQQTDNQPTDRQPLDYQQGNPPPSLSTPVTSAQIGILDSQQAREIALHLVNTVPELSRLPSTVKAGLTFYVLNPDGSLTDIPESNVSFTLETGGRLRFGLAKGINLKVRMPLWRLMDLDNNFCQGVSDMIQGNEVNLDYDLPAMDRIALVSAALSARNRCNLS